MANSDSVAWVLVERKVSSLLSEYIKEVGAGQFTYQGWVRWLQMTEPQLIETLLIDSLRLTLERKQLK